MMLEAGTETAEASLVAITADNTEKLRNLAFMPCVSLGLSFPMVEQH